jgi:hypothetical protein
MALRRSVGPEAVRGKRRGVSRGHNAETAGYSGAANAPNLGGELVREMSSERDAHAPARPTIARMAAGLQSGWMDSAIASA